MAERCRAWSVGLEFTSNFAYADDLVPRIQAIRDVPLLAHNYFPPPREPFVLNLAATDPEIRAASLTLCRTAIELSATIGASFYGVHSGFAMNLTASQLGQPDQQAALPAHLFIEPKTAWKTFRESVVELSAFAQARGIRLLLENNVITPQQAAAGRGDSLLMTSPEECCQFFDELGDPNVGLLLDTGHARVSAQALGFAPEDFFSLGDHLRALHLSDNDGLRDNNRPFSLDAWFAPYLAKFRDLPMVIEVYGLHDEDCVKQYSVLFSLLH